MNKIMFLSRNNLIEQSTLSVIPWANLVALVSNLIRRYWLLHKIYTTLRSTFLVKSSFKLEMFLLKKFDYFQYNCVQDH